MVHYLRPEKSAEASWALYTTLAHLVESAQIKLRILAHPVVSVFYQLSPKQQKYQNLTYKKAVREWLR